MIDPNFGIYDSWKRGYTPNPFFTISNQFMPRNFKELLRWADYIITQSPTAAEVIRKHATYPITDFIFDTDNEEHKKRYLKWTKILHLKTVLNEIGFNYYTRGNVFVSVYLPFIRWVKCRACQTDHNLSHTGSVKFTTNGVFSGTCPKCSSKGVFDVRDEMTRSENEMSIISWDPHCIVTNHNPVTNKSEFYFQIPASMRKKILLGDPMFISTLPLAMLQAAVQKKQFKFNSRSIFHLRNLSVGKTEEGLSIPPIMAIYSLVFHQAMMRRANEAIASEHMTPMRVIFPQTNGSNGDPVVTMSMAGFVSNMETNIRKFKHDPNHQILSPVPIGYESIGGEGKSMLVAQELQLAEETILMSLGVSRELMAGTVNWTSSTVGLRLLKNSMENYVRQIQELIDWIFDIITGFLKVSRVNVSLSPFQLSDDDLLKQLLPSFIDKGVVSKTTALASVGIDYLKELDKKVKEAEAEAKAQVNIETATERARVHAHQENASDTNKDMVFEQVKARAYDIFLQLASLDPGSQQMALLQLEHEDKALYETVVAMLPQQAPAPTAEPSPGKGDTQQ